VRAEQTVSEMVTEALGRQAEALADDMGRPFEEAFVEVLDTPAGRLLAELADSPHRHESAAYWQARLRAEREAERPAALLRAWPTTGERHTEKEQVTQMRVLLVEDNEPFGEALARMLELELAPEVNVVFAQADSLAEAHALLRQEEGLDAALVDVGLPDGDGLDLVRELEVEGGRFGALPTLVITANPGHAVAARATEVGARGVLSKMVSTKEMAETVRTLICAGRAPG
jgi:CheY-like chemotaxis protein